MIKTEAAVNKTVQEMEKTSALMADHVPAVPLITQEMGPKSAGNGTNTSGNRKSTRGNAHKQHRL